MGMPALYYTADMVRALPADGNKYELVYGELLVTPAPRMWHEVVQRRLQTALDGYLARLTWHPAGATAAFTLPLSALLRAL